MIYHALFWLCYYIFGALISLSVHRIYDPRFYAELLSLLPPDMVLVYINLYILIPAFLLKKSYFVYFPILLMTMCATSSLNIWLHHLYTVNGSPFFAGNSELTIPGLAAQLFNSIYLVGLTTGLKFFKDSMEQRERIREQEKQQIALELNFLKAQVHPHFFFNTLNNLYSLTLHKSDLAPEVVLKLSALMSYMLYESGATYVPLDKELANLENYVALEQLRFGKRLALSFKKEGIPSDPVNIPPLILLTFVENSFKHGMSQTIGEGRIDISLKVGRHQLFFEVDNSIGDIPQAGNPFSSPAYTHGAPHPTTDIHAPFPLTSATYAQPQPTSATYAPSQPTSANGLGLRNVTRRLDLLYGTRYGLDKTETANHFRVTLKIPLT
ncbi:MAG TPA: histidine kinase [Puia sp.]|jgi:LytS/YehU family sensor histidine kinase|nr:histidine kinase [Puia sp.]